MAYQFARNEMCVVSLDKLRTTNVDLVSGDVSYNFVSLSDTKIRVTKPDGTEYYFDSMSTLPAAGISLLGGTDFFYLIQIDLSMVAGSSGTWTVTLIDNASTTAAPFSQTSFQYLGSYGYLCQNAQTTFEALSYRILPSPLPFLPTESPQINYLIGAGYSHGDVLANVYDPNGNTVASAIALTQVGTSEVWRLSVPTNLFVSGQWSFLCYVNGTPAGTTNRTGTFVWADANDAAFGSYPKLNQQSQQILNLDTIIKKRLFNRLKVDAVANTMTLYDDDNTSVLFVWDLLPNASNILERIQD